MDKDTILHLLREEKPALEKTYFINKVGLFGSFVSGIATTESDIDIVYEMEQGHYLGYDDQLNLKKRLHTLLKKKIDLVRLKYMNPAIRVKAESQIIYV